MGETLFRAIFAVVVVVAAIEPTRALGSAANWRPGTWEASVGHRLVQPGPRAALAGALLFSAVAFTVGVLTPIAAVFLAASFAVTAVLYLGQTYAGYVTVDEDDRPRSHVNHHLHLVGLATIAVACAAVVATFADRSVTMWSAQALWGAVAAHYFTSGVTKLRRAGLHWPDRRLLPFYLTLMALYEEGNGNAIHQTRLQRALLTHHRWGLVVLWSALLLELSAPLMLVGPWPRAFLAAGLVGFHIGTFFVLSVDFRENAMVVALAGLPLP